MVLSANGKEVCRGQLAKRSRPLRICGRTALGGLASVPDVGPSPSYNTLWRRPLPPVRACTGVVRSSDSSDIVPVQAFALFR